MPYRALVAENYPNLLVAGRCISADKTAFASLRVQASCMGMGQAAGVVAAMCTTDKSNVQEVNIDALVERLRLLGAVV